MVLGLFGSVWATGDNGFGQLGNGPSNGKYAMYSLGFVDVMPTGQSLRHYSVLTHLHNFICAYNPLTILSK